MAYNFNNSLSGAGDQGLGLGAPSAETPAPAPSRESPGPGASSPTPIPMTPVTSEESAAGIRFKSCRWMQKEESGNQAFCTHREVKPYAGMQGFDADAWCPECQYYKLRRAPRKRGEEPYTY